MGRTALCLLTYMLLEGLQALSSHFPALLRGEEASRRACFIGAIPPIWKISSVCRLLRPFPTRLSGCQRLRVVEGLGLPPSRACCYPLPHLKMCQADGVEGSMGEGLEGGADGRVNGSEEEKDAGDYGFADYVAGGADRLVIRLRQGDVTSLEGREGARKCIIELEQQRNFPFDPGFFSLAVSGEWELLYSTSRVLAPDPNLKVRKIISDMQGFNKTLTHRVMWEYAEEGSPPRETKGIFEIVCKYNLSDVPSVPTRMIIAVEEYSLTCEPLNKTPKDPQALVAALQRALPREFFDPDEALMDTTYLNPNVRLVCYLGKRFAGVRHVYTRKDESSALSKLSNN